MSIILECSANGGSTCMQPSDSKGRRAGAYSKLAAAEAGVNVGTGDGDFSNGPRAE